MRKRKRRVNRSDDSIELEIDTEELDKYLKERNEEDMQNLEFIRSIDPEFFEE